MKYIKEFLLKLPFTQGIIDDALAVHIKHYESVINNLNHEISLLKQKLKKFGG